MPIEISYPLDVVALAHGQGGWAWHVSPRECWILDLPKYRSAYARIGASAPWSAVFDHRRELETVSEAQSSRFLEMMAPYRVEPSDLQSELRIRAEQADFLSDISEWLPSIFVDFKSRVFVSNYPEPFSFERYIPERWTGRFGEFYDLVPPHMKYWIDNGVSLIGNLV